MNNINQQDSTADCLPSAIEPPAHTPTRGQGGKIMEFTEEQRTTVLEQIKKEVCASEATYLAMMDAIPLCMSEALGKAAIPLQDVMPDKMRNSDRYKNLVPDMAGTGRKHEQERLKVLMGWLWDVVLSQLQEIADEDGFGDLWRTMCQERTTTAADAVYAAAEAACAHAARAAYSGYAYNNFWHKVDPIGMLERMTYFKQKRKNDDE